jgi:D-glycero-D-manno-heptose 1,7-bisphosphate phosphatase
MVSTQQGRRGRQALFLDRDGTLVQPRHYPSRPADLLLYEGIGPHLRALQEAGLRLVLITNQSGLARGLFTTGDLDLMHAHLAAELARSGVRLDAVYYCPHHVDGTVPGLAVACDCRKPQPGMLLRAAADLELDLARSWFVGDILDDVEAGNRAGCRTVLVDLGTEAPPATSRRRPDYAARDTTHALRIVAHREGIAPGEDANPDLDYRPISWRAAPAPVETVTAGWTPAASAATRGIDGDGR